MRRAFFIAVVVAALALGVGLVGCASGSSNTTEVRITDSGFTPADVSIKVGQMMTWANDGTTLHTVTWGDGDSGGIAQGDTYSHTFEQAGTYDYYCRYHPSAKGRVTVQ